MKTYINPNRIIKAYIHEPEEKYVCDILGFSPGHGWQVIVILDGNEDVIIYCESIAECIELCNKLKLIEV